MTIKMAVAIASTLSIVSVAGFMVFFPGAALAAESENHQLLENNPSQSLIVKPGEQIRNAIILAGCDKNHPKECSDTNPTG